MKGRGSNGCCTWLGMVVLLYVTLHRSPFGPTPSCRTVRPSFGWPRPGSGGSPMAGAWAPTCGAGGPCVVGGLAAAGDGVRALFICSA